MSALRVAVIALWIGFWLYWLIAARNVKRGSRARSARPASAAIIALALLLPRALGASALNVRSPALGALGLAILVASLAFAVWARVYLGRNWGMPMTAKREPELVTSGPYRLVRHPIYAGLLGGMLGTALATNPLALIAVALMGGYFLHCARVEEELMRSAFPGQYERYCERTKLLIPFLL